MDKNRDVITEAARRLLAVSAIFLLGNASALECSPKITPNQISAANAYLEQNAPKDAFALMYPLSQEGRGGATNYLSRLYETGVGLQKSPFMVRHLNWMGALENDADSMYRASLDFYQKGHRKDGEHWAVRAKDCGHPEALIFLIKTYINDGRSDEARILLEQAIDKSLVEAKFILAEQYDKGGLGLPQDKNTAFNWYYLAAKDGHASAMASIAYYFARGIHGVQDDVAAIEWYHRAAKAGHVESITAYAWMLENGKGAQKNVEDATYYYKKASRRGDKNAQAFLSELLKNNNRAASAFKAQHKDKS